MRHDLPLFLDTKAPHAAGVRCRSRLAAAVPLPHALRSPAAPQPLSCPALPLLQQPLQLLLPPSSTQVQLTVPPVLHCATAHRCLSRLRYCYAATAQATTAAAPNAATAANSAAVAAHIATSRRYYYGRSTTAAAATAATTAAAPLATATDAATTATTAAATAATAAETAARAATAAATAATAVAAAATASAEAATTTAAAATAATDAAPATTTAIAASTAAATVATTLATAAAAANTATAAAATGTTTAATAATAAATAVTAATTAATAAAAAPATAAPSTAATVTAAATAAAPASATATTAATAAATTAATPTAAATAFTTITLAPLLLTAAARHGHSFLELVKEAGGGFGEALGVDSSGGQVGRSGGGAGGTSTGGTRGSSAGGAAQPVHAPPFFLPQPESSLPPPGSALRQVLTSRHALPVCTVHRARRIPPPPIPGMHTMTLRPSSVPQRVALPSPPASSLPDVHDPESDLVHAATPTVTRFQAIFLTDPSFDFSAVPALVTKLLELECFTAAVPYLAAMLLCYEGDLGTHSIPTPRFYAGAITGPYSSQWEIALDAEMASWKSTGTYVDAVPPRGANIVDGMWIFRVKRPSGSPPTFLACYRDYELPSLDFSTAFLQSGLHEEIWLCHPTGFTGSFPEGAQWSLERPVYDPSLPPFYILVYADDLVFATGDTKALDLVKTKLQKRYASTGLSPLALRLSVLLATVHPSAYMPLALNSISEQVPNTADIFTKGVESGGHR
ncbi:unnamed protein product [Closterium sp. NIES-53]